MTDQHTLTATLAQLRAPFKRSQIGKLPATSKRPALDFVGHAAVTDRLNTFAPEWTYTIDERFDHDGQCWVRGTLTILGITRVDYGDGKDPKEAIGNFIRRAAMRFGVAIDLWSREELTASDSGTTSHPQVTQTGRDTLPVSPSVPESDSSSSAVIGSAGEAEPGSGVPKGTGEDSEAPDPGQLKHEAVWIQSPKVKSMVVCEVPRCVLHPARRKDEVPA